MNPFRYIVYLIGELFTAKAALRPSMDEDTFLDLLAARSSLTRAQVEKVIIELFTLFVELARQSIPVGFILQRFRMLPVSGGRYNTPDPAAEDVRDTLSYSLIVHPNEIDKMRLDCPVEKVGDAGVVTPAVHSVRGRPGNVVGRYGVGLTGGCEVNGDHFRDKRADAAWCTAALVDQNGNNPIPLAVLDCSPTRLVIGGAPVGTTGPRYLKITDADGRFTLYDEPLLPTP